MNMDNIAYSPELAEVCTNCKYPDCVGVCREYREVYFKLTGQHVGRQAEMFEYRGEWRTILDWSEILNMGEETIRRKLKSGMSIAGIIQERDSHMLRKKEPLYAFGKSQPLRQWAIEYGIPYNTLYDRIRKGIKLEKAIQMSIEPKEKERKKYDTSLRTHHRSNPGV